MHPALPAQPAPSRDQSTDIGANLHADFPLEWWFIHGYFEGDTLCRKYFMASFFRHRLNGSRDAHSFLLAHLDTGSYTNETVSRVNRALIDQFAGQVRQVEDLPLDAHLAKAYVDQYQRSECLREIDLDHSPVSIQTDPLKIRWRDFSLQRGQDRFLLDFNGPATGTRHRLSLHPLASQTFREMALKCYADLRGMAYVSYPRLALRGSVDGVAVKGQAWLDHQWGNFGWMIQSGHEKKILGWDWFGLTMDDGSAWVIIAHRDAASGDVLDTNVVFRDRRGTVRTSTHFLHHPLRHWESPQTVIRYPVAWRIQVPEFDAEFTFNAYHDDQEIRVFGPLRAIWEGAGSVQGKIAGRKVRGWARGELHGYGYLFDYPNYMERLGARVSSHIEGFIPKKMDAPSLENYLGSPTWDYEPEAYTEMLSVPVWDLVSRKGKRWRPIFAIFLLDALGKSPRPYEALVSNLAELAHSGSLIIDDIQDHSLLRRGEACIHSRYGEEVAISVANTLYFLSFHHLFGHPHLTNLQQLEIHEIVIKQFTRAHFGQALDLYWTRNLTDASLQQWMNDSLDTKLFQMYQLKTAAPLEGLAEAAAVIAGSDDGVREASIGFARALGIAFQIIDDVNNFSTSPQWRKKRGEDVSEGKITYVIASVLKNLNGSKRKRFKEILTNKMIRGKDAFLDEAVDLVETSGALEKCRHQAMELIEPEWRRLDRILPPSEPKIFLQAMVNALLNIT